MTDETEDRVRDAQTNVYEAFIQELDYMLVAASDPATKVVGDLTRAVKRAQMVVDGELKPVRERLGLS